MSPQVGDICILSSPLSVWLIYFTGPFLQFTYIEKNPAQQQTKNQKQQTNKKPSQLLACVFANVGLCKPDLIVA